MDFDTIIDDVLAGNINTNTLPTKRIRLVHSNKKELQILESLSSLKNHWISENLILESWSKYKSKSMCGNPCALFNNFIDDIINKAKNVDEESKNIYNIIKESKNEELLMDVKNSSLVSLIEDRSIIINLTKNKLINMKPTIINFMMESEDPNLSSKTLSSVEEKLNSALLKSIKTCEADLSEAYGSANAILSINNENININLIKDIKFIRLLLSDSENNSGYNSILNSIVSGRENVENINSFINQLNVANKQISENLILYLNEIDKEIKRLDKTNEFSSIFDMEVLYEALKYSKYDLKTVLKNQLANVLISFGYGHQTSGGASANDVVSDLIFNPKSNIEILAKSEVGSLNKTQKKDLFNLIQDTSRAIDDVYDDNKLIDRKLSKLNELLDFKYAEYDLKKSIVDNGQQFLNTILNKAKKAYEIVKKKMIELSNNKVDPVLIESLGIASLPTSYARFSDKSNPIIIQLGPMLNKPQESNTEYEQTKLFSDTEYRTEDPNSYTKRVDMYINEYILAYKNNISLDKITENLISDIANNNMPIISDIMKEVGTKIINNVEPPAQDGGKPQWVIERKNIRDCFNTIMDELFIIIKELTFGSNFDSSVDNIDKSFNKLIKSILSKNPQSLDALIHKNLDEEDISDILGAAIETNDSKCVKLAIDIIDNISISNISLKEHYINNREKNNDIIEFDYRVASGISPKIALMNYYIKIKKITNNNIAEIVKDNLDFAMNTYGRYYYNYHIEKDDEIKELITLQNNLNNMLNNKKFNIKTENKLNNDLIKTNEKIEKIQFVIASNIIDKAYKIKLDDPSTPKINVLNPNGYPNLNETLKSDDSTPSGLDKLDLNKLNPEYRKLCEKLISQDDSTDINLYDALRSRFPDIETEMVTYDGIWSPGDNPDTHFYSTKLNELKSDLYRNLGQIEFNDYKKFKSIVTNAIPYIEDYINLDNVKKLRSATDQEALIEKINSIFQQYKKVYNDYRNEINLNPKHSKDRMLEIEENADKDEMFPYQITITNKKKNNYIEIKNKQDDEFEPIIIKTGKLKANWIIESLKNNVNLKNKKQFRNSKFINYYLNTNQIIEVLDQFIPKHNASGYTRFYGKVIDDALDHVENDSEFLYNYYNIKKDELDELESKKLLSKLIKQHIQEFTDTIKIPDEQIANTKKIIKPNIGEKEVEEFRNALTNKLRYQSDFRSEEDKIEAERLAKKGLSPEEIENRLLSTKIKSLSPEEIDKYLSKDY
jgi:hypothetical protein